ncbi:unnamed protein product [Microthlaspi erraticum]|uniref:Helicase protein MOM1 n=1 Tax=Microthlaspi erraticum TaxID=1685480 RepID=A0A6D2I777_9BRAS|nr:unnamed protein product [Microthlaspi erraticum]
MHCLSDCEVGLMLISMADEVACLLPSSPTGNQHGPAATIEGQNINTSAELHIAGLGAVEIGDSAVSNQERTGAQDACSLLSSLVGTQADLAANTEGQNITRVTQLHTAGSDAVEIGGSAVSDQAAVDASHVPFSSPGNPTTESDACEMEIAEPGRQVEQSTFANNVAQLVRIGGVEPSASVTAPVPSLLNNGAGQSAVQPVPQVPFPQFTDPFQYELEKLRRESENVNKTFEEKTSILRAELERKLAEVRAEYQRKFHEVEVEKNARETEVERTKNIVIMNKLLGNAFLSKCTTKIASHPSEAPRGRIQQLALRAGLVTALRNYTASPPAPTLAPPAHVPAVSLPPAPLQRQASAFPSSVPRTSGLPLNSAVCPMPQPRQPLVSSPAPSFSASPATNLTESARPPHLNSYRSSSSIPIPTSTPTSLPIAQALSSYATLLLQSHQQQRQQHQQNLGIGLQQLQQNLGLGLQQQQQQQHQHQQSLGSGLQQNLGVGLQQQQQQQHQQSVGSGLQQNLGIGLQQQQQQQQQQHQQSLGSGLQQLQQNLGSGLQGPNRNDDVVCLSDDE